MLELQECGCVTEDSYHYEGEGEELELKKRPSAGSPILPRPQPIAQPQVYDGLDEEEDMPLAIWQEQQQRSRRR